MTNSKKRPRSAADQEDDKTCPFSVEYVASPDREGFATGLSKKGAKRRKQTPEDEESRKTFMQLSPFSPMGRFLNKTYETMDVHYKVSPTKAWTEMTRYNSFVLNGHKYLSEGFIYVANQATVDGTGLDEGEPQRDGWIARILEIRASDEHHVYARVFWMYWPEELWPGTLYDKKKINGRQPWHGRRELIASNHMDIINVISVTSPATVNQWDEANDDEVHDALYWRQALDYRTLELSSVEPNCRCGQPANPDKILLGCPNPDCHKWLHIECLTDDVLMKTWARFGKEKPHKPAFSPMSSLKEEEEGVKQPLSPKEPVKDATQPTIDVHPDDVSAPTEASEDKLETIDENPIKTSDASSPPPEPKAVARRPKQKAKDDPTKPWLGYFDATILPDATPPTVEIYDLREDVDGLKTWTESLSCLVCGTPID